MGSSAVARDKKDPTAVGFDDDHRPLLSSLFDTVLILLKYCFFGSRGRNDKAYYYQLYRFY
jgi:hypothetical protein